MGRATIELEISSEVLDVARAIADAENSSVEAVLQAGLKRHFEESFESRVSLDRLDGYGIDELWSVVHQRLTPAQDRRLHELTALARDGEIKAQEDAEFHELLGLVEKQMLMRSRALALLQERGQDIASYLNSRIESYLQDGQTPSVGGLPKGDMSMDRMNEFNDEQLWAIANRRSSWAQDCRWRELQALNKQGALSVQQSEEMDELLHAYDRQVLLRSRALVLMKRRGHDIDAYLGFAT